jgi:hypothetical protein
MNLLTRRNKNNMVSFFKAVYTRLFKYIKELFDSEILSQVVFQTRKTKVFVSPTVLRI